MPELPLDFLDLDEDEVRSRFRWARRHGHPAWLWPDVAVDDWRNALLSIESVTRKVLAGEGGPVCLAGEPDALGIAAYTSGMGPLLGHWIETGRVRAADASESLLRLHLRHNRSRLERLTREALDVIATLADEGIIPTVLKGMHTAHAYFPEPGTRPLSDIDLAVAPAQLDATSRALRLAGYTPGTVQRRPYKCEWVRHDGPALPRSLSLSHQADPFAVDVHTSLDRNFFGVGIARLGGIAATRATPAWNLAPAARTLAQPLLTLLLTIHASEGFHSLTLLRLVELILVIRRDSAAGKLEWDELIDVAASAGALRFAYPALSLCERLAPRTVPAVVLARFEARATPAMRRVLADVTPATAQRLDRLSVGERFMWAGTPWERLRRTAYALWPAPAGRSLSALGEIYAGRARRLMRGTVDR